MTTYLIVCKSNVNFIIHGNPAFIGPCGLIAIDEGHRPTWVRDSFNSAVVDASDPSCDKIKEIINLIRDGHAKVLSNVSYTHVSTGVAASLIDAVAVL